MGNEINHTGIIRRIEGDTIFVKIIQQSACSGCHAKSMCSASESKEKIIEVIDNSGQFNVHDEVMINGKTSLGLQAVLLAFVLPLLLMILALITGHTMHWDEGTNALTALLLLIPYYGILYLLRDKLKRKFIFTLKKLN